MTRPTSRRLRVRFGVVNAPISVGPRAWRACLGLLMRRVDIGGVNEALSPRQRRLYRRVARLRGWGFFGTGSPNPVFWDADLYRFESGQVHRLHDAGTGFRARRFRGFNAARYATEVVLREKASGIDVAVLCFHLAPGGRKVSTAWRRQVVAQSVGILEHLIERHTRAGRVVLVFGDTNAERLRIDGVRWIHDGGIDKAGIALPEGAEVTASRHGRFTAPTDHRAGTWAVVRVAFTPHLRSAA